MLHCSRVGEPDGTGLGRPPGVRAEGKEVGREWGGVEGGRGAVRFRDYFRGPDSGGWILVPSPSRTTGVHTKRRPCYPRSAWPVGDHSE